VRFFGGFSLSDLNCRTRFPRLCHTALLWPRPGCSLPWRQRTGAKGGMRLRRSVAVVQQQHFARVYHRRWGLSGHAQPHFASDSACLSRGGRYFFATHKSNAARFTMRKVTSSISVRALESHIKKGPAEAGQGREEVEIFTRFRGIKSWMRGLSLLAPSASKS